MACQFDRPPSASGKLTLSEKQPKNELEQSVQTIFERAGVYHSGRRCTNTIEVFGGFAPESVVAFSCCE